MASPLRQARPYPRWGSWTTRAPIFAAISGVPSVELLSTTSTSVTRLAGRSARTRLMADASLRVGMMTDTRTGTWLKSPPRRRRTTLRQPCVYAPRSARAPDRERKRCEYRNQEYTERDFRQGLHGSRHRGMARRQAHDSLPNSRRMTMFDVVVDEASVARRRVEAFSQILKKDPHQHRADRHPHDCETVCRLRLVGHLCYLIWHCRYVRSHCEPRNPMDGTPD